MKLRIENLATLLLIVAMLLDGCSGCEQKTQQKTTDYNRELENVRQAKLDAVYATKGLSTDERNRRIDSHRGTRRHGSAYLQQVMESSASLS